MHTMNIDLHTMNIDLHKDPSSGHVKERPSASEEVVARPRNILARPRNIFARPSPIQVNPSYFSSFERRLMVNETFWTSSMPFLTRPRQIQDHFGRLRAERIRASFLSVQEHINPI